MKSKRAKVSAEVSENALEVLAVSAVRYALGRMSTAASDVCGACLAIPLPLHAWKQIYLDLDRRIKEDDRMRAEAAHSGSSFTVLPLGMDVDRQHWLEFREEVRRKIWQIEQQAEDAQSSTRAGPYHELHRAIEAAKQIQSSVREPDHGFDENLRVACRYLYGEPPYLGPAKAALLKLCGYLLNDDFPQISEVPDPAKTKGKRQMRFMVANTKYHAQFFAFADTEEGAIRAFLERAAGRRSASVEDKS